MPQGVRLMHPPAMPVHPILLRQQEPQGSARLTVQPEAFRESLKMYGLLLGWGDGAVLYPSPGRGAKPVEPKMPLSRQVGMCLGRADGKWTWADPQ